MNYYLFSSFCWDMGRVLHTPQIKMKEDCIVMHLSSILQQKVSTGALNFWQSCLSSTWCNGNRQLKEHWLESVWGGFGYWGHSCLPRLKPYLSKESPNTKSEWLYLIRIVSTEKCPPSSFSKLPASIGQHQEVFSNPISIAVVLLVCTPRHVKRGWEQHLQPP